MHSILRTMIVVALIYGEASSYTAITKPDTDSTTVSSVVSAVAGGDTLLPCDTIPPQVNDSLLLVVWYRDETPIYSYDDRLTGHRAHWSENNPHDGYESLTGRARWQKAPDATGLSIRQVKPGDAGKYRCRVDFKISPTKNFRVNLEITVLPDKPSIFDEFGKEVKGIAGPYVEGGSFQLTCRVTGGNPTPRIRWFKDESILATSEDPGNDLTLPGDGKALQLKVENLTRAHMNAIYTCAADNTPLAMPVKSTAQIDLYLRPLSVEILDRDQPLSAGREAHISCRSGGARPSSELSWWIDGKQLINTSKQQNADNDNVTVSTLTWTPKTDDNGKILSCKARHKAFNHSVMEALLPLTIQFAPMVSLQLGSKMNPFDIEEGDDVYFECKVRANPPAYKVLWEHNGVVMQHNQKAGVLAGTDHLALRNVSRQHSGRYLCSASNVEGDGKSPVVNLQVMYKPMCRAGAQVVYGAGLQEKTQIVCLVDSHPAPDAFTWFLNNSAKAIEVDKNRYTVESSAGRSVLTYTPTSELDYGTLSCRAANLAGQQIEPCTFTVLPTAKPDPVKNCTVYNVTDRELYVRCDPGYDGGLKTSFNMESWLDEVLVENQTSPKPEWILRNLLPTKVVKILVYSSNARGRAKPVTLKAQTMDRIEPRTEAQAAWEVSAWAVGGIVGAAGAIGAILCLALLTTRIKRRSRDYDVNIDAEKSHKSSPLTSRTSPVVPDDKNPDVVPLNKGTYSSLTNQALAGSIEGVREPPPYCPAPQHPPRPPRTNSHNSLQGDFATMSSSRGSRREVVTTRTPLLSSAHQESCV